MNNVHPTIWYRLFILAIAAILTSTGCGRRMDKWEARRPKTYRVQGRVLLDGKPEADVIVSFESKAHNLTAVGLTDADGRFLLKTFKEGDGAVAGDHAVALVKRIQVAPADAAPDAPRTEVLVSPKRYATSATSGLTATVVEKGPNAITFEMSK
jgi:uncharacterized SAM-binding protein YcdF (DUF218 family)